MTRGPNENHVGAVSRSDIRRVLRPRKSRLYVRFVVGKRSENAWRLTGVVTAAARLLRRRQLNREEAQVVRAAFRWFNDNIPCPPFESKRKAGEWTEDAVSWFRDEARRPINKLRPLKAILRRHGLTVRMLRARNPGRIIYADEYQVVAETPAEA